MSSHNDGSLRDHLVDLRVSIIRVLWILFFGFIACLYFSEQIFDFIRAPIAPYLSGTGLVFTAPIDKFTAYLKVSALAGAVITCPLWLYQVWWFIAPGLYEHEKKLGAIFIFAGSILFILGIVFVYQLVFPMAFKYLLTFGGTTDQPMITIKDYLSFFITTTLIFGLAFEMPLVIIMLGLLGIIDAQTLREKRKIAIMLVAVLSAIVTPPDALSMLSLLIPMALLYELSIIIVGVLAKKRAAKVKE